MKTKIDKTLQYKKDAKLLVEIIGKDNIITASHCQTRIRLALNDSKKVNTKEIEKLESVKGTFTAGGQFQIIIGVDVSEFFKYFLLESGIKASQKEDVKKAVKVSQNKFQKTLTAFGEIFLPLIPVIVAGGIILAFRNILELDWTSNNPDKVTAATNLAFFSYLDAFLWLPAQAIFWYLPVMVVWSIFNRKNVYPAVGIVIGITLVSPGILVNLYAISDTIGKIHVSTGLYGVETWHLGMEGTTVVYLAPGNYTPEEVINSYNAWVLVTGAPFDLLSYNASNQEIINALNVAEASQYNQVFINGKVDQAAYQGASYEVKNIFNAINATGAYFFLFWPLALGYVGQVIPAMLVGVFAVWFYMLVERHTWKSIAYVWPPLVTILVADVLAHGIIGPIGAVLAFGITSTFKWAFTSVYIKYIFAPIFGALYPVIVITGLHQTFNAVMISLSMPGVDANYIFPILALSNVAQGAAVFAVVYLARGNKKIKEVGEPAAVTCWMGVTEPAMYGVNLKYFFPFVAAMIGSAVGATLTVGLGITALGIGMGGVLGFLNVNHIIGSLPIWSAWFIYLAIMGLVIAITFFLTIAFSKIKFFERFGTGSWEEVLKDTKQPTPKTTM